MVIVSSSTNSVLRASPLRCSAPSPRIASAASVPSSRPAAAPTTTNSDIQPQPGQPSRAASRLASSLNSPRATRNRPPSIASQHKPPMTSEYTSDLAKLPPGIAASSSAMAMQITPLLPPRCRKAPRRGPVNPFIARLCRRSCQSQPNV